MRKVFVPMVLLLCFSTILASSWEIAKKVDIKFNPRGFYALNQDTIWMVGDDGMVVKTEDGGESWIVLRDANPDGINWNDVEFATAMVGYACADDGQIYKTEDGGESWVSIADSLSLTVDFNYITVFSTSLFYVAGDDGVFLKSTDGGNSFTISSESFNAEDLDGGMAFCNENVGVVVADANSGSTWYTYDGGSTWEYVSVAPLFPAGTISKRLYAAVAGGDSTIVISGYHYTVFLSQNGGRSYSLIGHFTNDFERFTALELIDENHFLAGGSSGFLVYTENAGSVWDTLQTLSGQDIEFISAQGTERLFLIQAYQQWFRSDDRGENWVPLLNWPGVCFSDLETAPDGRIFLSARGGGEIAYSDENGLSWYYPSNLATRTDASLYEVRFSSSTVGYSGGSKGVLLKTQDAGKTWSRINNPIEDLGNKHIYALTLLNENNLVIGGSSGNLFYTNNGGESWEGGTLCNKTIYDLFAFSPGRFLAAASSGQFYLSCLEEDSISMELVDDFGSMKLNALDFYGNSGIIVGDDGYIFKIYVTNDDSFAVDSVVQVYHEVNETDLNDVRWISENQVYVVGDNGIILKSDDGGASWAAMESPVTDNLLALDGNQTGLWAAGDFGVVLHLNLEPTVLTLNEAQMDTNNDFIPDLLGETVSVRGIVSTINYQPGGSYYYLQDGTGAICFYSSDFEVNLNIGDEIELSGIINQYYGLTEIVPDSISQIAILSSGNDVVPLPVTLSELNETLESFLVEVDSVWFVNPEEWPPEGEDGYNVQITDGLDTMKLLIDKDTDLDGWLPFDGLQSMKITGVVHQYSHNIPPDDGYELRPRSRADFEKTSSIVSGIHYPSAFAISQNFPNPFNTQTNFILSNHIRQKITVEIYDIGGRRLSLLLNEVLPPGKYELSWDGKSDDGSSLPSGIYFCRVKSADNSLIRRMLLLK